MQTERRDQPPELELSDRKRWEVETAFREREVVVKEEDLRLRTREHFASQWRNPLFAAVMGATVAAIGSIAVAYLNATQQRTIDIRRFEQQEIVEMLKAGDLDKAVHNLAWLLDNNFIMDTDLRERLKTLVTQVDPKSVPVFATASQVTSPTISTSAPGASAQAGGPRDELQLARQLEAAVEGGRYADATELFPRLRDSVFSGVGYSAYPKAAFAFDQMSKPEDALRVLALLENRLSEDAAKGYGYLAPGRPPRDVLRKDLTTLLPKVRAAAVKTRMEQVRDSL